VDDSHMALNYKMIAFDETFDLYFPPLPKLQALRPAVGEDLIDLGDEETVKTQTVHWVVCVEFKGASRTTGV
jgi:hypothetical protein